MLLDEFYPPVPAHRQQAHHLIEIAHRSAGRCLRRADCNGGEDQGQQQRTDGAPHYARGASGGRQKS